VATETIFTSQTPNGVDTVSGVARMLGMKWKTSSTGKRVTGGRIWIGANGLQTGMRWQLWQAPSTLLVDILLDGMSVTNNAWNSVAGIPSTDVTQNQDYYVTHYYPSTSVGNYIFGNPPMGPITNGSITANGIFRNSGTSSQPPNDETFTGGVFFADITLDDASTGVTVGLPVETDSTLGITTAFALTVGLPVETDSTLAPTFAGGATTILCPGSPALSPCDLAGIIGTVVAGMPDSCTVQHMNWSTPNGFGGTTVAVDSQSASACRVLAKLGKLADDPAASGQQVFEYHVYLPPTVTIKPKDRILYGGRTLQVVGIAAPQTEQLMIEVLAKEVAPSG